MLKVVVPTALVALALGVLAGHYVWPVRKGTQGDAPSRASRFRPPPTVGIDGTPGEAPAPEIWTVDQVMKAVDGVTKLTGSSKRMQAMEEIIPHLEPADAPELAPKLVPFANDRAITQLLYMVMSGWSEGDPEAAVQFAVKVANEPLRATLVQQAMHPFAEANLEAAIAFAQGLPQGSLRATCLDMVMGAAAMNDPKRALALMTTLPRGANQHETRSVFSTWAAHDLDGAVSAALAMPDGKQRTQAVEAVIAEWAEKDPQKALEWAVQHNSERSMSDALENCFAGATVERPDLAAAYVAKLDDGATRDGIIGTLAIRWAGEDAEAAKKWALGLSDRDRTLALEGMVNGMHYDSPTTALELARAIEDPRERGRSIGTVLTSWADREPEAAWKEAQALEAGPEKDEIVANMVGSLARTNPMAAAEALTDMEGPEAERAAAEVARAWTELDPQAAQRWVERMPDGDAKKRATSSLASTWVTDDPIAATEWAERHGDLDAKREMTMIWAQTDSQAATEWAMAHSGRASEEGLFEQAIGFWASSDARRAAAWAGDLPRGERRDAAFQQLSENTLYQDPETAMTYVDEMSDPKARDEVRAAMYASWQTNDPKRAKRWLGTSKYAPMLAALAQGQEAIEDATPVNPECVCPPPGAP